MLPLMLAAISLSLDALGVGMAYGLRSIYIPLRSKLLMSFLSTLCSFIAVCTGKLLYAILPDWLGKYISPIILTILGLYMLISAVRESSFGKSVSSHKTPVRKYQFSVKVFGLSVTIILHPLEMDWDHSKTIDSREAACLALALSLDSLAAGIGYCMEPSSSVIFPIFIGGFQLIFITLGIFCGHRFKQKKWLNKTFLSFIPGIIMLGLAFGRLAGI